MIFTGMKPLALDLPLIEIETANGSVRDLYNEHYLRSVEVRRDDLEFTFSATHDSTSTALKFLGVRGLTVVQPEDWHPGEADQIEYLLLRKKGPWRRVVFIAGGFQYEFDSTEVRIAVERVVETPGHLGENKSNG